MTPRRRVWCCQETSQQDIFLPLTLPESRGPPGQQRTSRQSRKSKVRTLIFPAISTWFACRQSCTCFGVIIIVGGQILVSKGVLSRTYAGWVTFLGDRPGRWERECLPGCERGAASEIQSEEGRGRGRRSDTLHADTHDAINDHLEAHSESRGSTGMRREGGDYALQTHDLQVEECGHASIRTGGLDVADAHAVERRDKRPRTSASGHHARAPT